jgi:hypothetical protein
MLKKTLLVATVVGLLAIGTAASVADTIADQADAAPAVQVQPRQQDPVDNPGPNERAAGVEPVQSRVRTQAHVEDGAGSGAALMMQTQNRKRLQVHDPAEMGEDAPMLQEREQVRVQVQDGTQTQAGTMTQTRTRTQDPETCDGTCVPHSGTSQFPPGAAAPHGDGECDQDGPEDGTGHQYGNGGGNNGGNGGGNGK